MEGIRRAGRYETTHFAECLLRGLRCHNTEQVENAVHMRVDGEDFAPQREKKDAGGRLHSHAFEGLKLFQPPVNIHVAQNAKVN